MKKIVILLCFIILSACNTSSAPVTTSTLTGKLSTKTSDGYLLQTKQDIVTINSTKLNLDSFLQKQITVTGMYSGSILYVDSATRLDN